MVQIMVTFGSLVAVMILGIIAVGGVGETWRIAEEGGRIEFWKFFFYNVILPSMTISPLNPMKDFESDEMQTLKELLDKCCTNEKQQKMQQLMAVIQRTFAY
ncbi:hypothetical protein EAG_15173 [Camponotus floridanus]|uniref:Uncharacterized protein n=1 Tax=Camponotus floridanus TaxID=104421 RepID=E2AQQ6_CAMFO|nr:hypothetical protein EAG_15173 [Camponotus floridanus]